MHGLMMNVPLMISSLIRHADIYHGDAEIVSRTIEGPIHRYTYRDAHVRMRRLPLLRSRRVVRIVGNTYHPYLWLRLRVTAAIASAGSAARSG